MAEDVSATRSMLNGIVFNDVFMRFYYQLSNQGAVVIKEFFADRRAFSAAIADAIMESLMQRIPELAEDEDLTARVMDAYGRSKWYADLMDRTDAFFEVGRTVRLISAMVDGALEQIPDGVLRKVDVEERSGLRFDGRYEPVFMEPETPPFGVPQPTVRPAP